MLLGLACWALPEQAAAAEGASTTQKTGKTKKKKSKKKAPEAESDTKQADELSTIGTLLKDAEYLTDARPNLQAKYYIFLHSASWCAPCQREMPKIADEYTNIKKSGKVELILASADDDPDKAIKFVSSNNGTFPIIAKGKMPQLPTPVTPYGFPWIIIVDADGKVIESAHGSSVHKWREFTNTPVEIDKSDNKEKPDPSAVVKALKEVEFISGKPANAKYYVFLHSASWCGPCCKLMPLIVEEYKKLKRKNIEIILVSGDFTVDEAKDYVKKYQVKFPTAMPAAIANVPGYQPPEAYPSVIVVDRTGRELAKGHGKIILELEEVLKQSKKKKNKNRD